MADKTLADMKVRLAGSDAGRGIIVTLEDFMRFDQALNRSLHELEVRWRVLAAPNASVQQPSRDR